MLLETKDKEQMMALMRAAVLQVSMVNYMSFDVLSMFQPIILSLEEENAVTELLNNPIWPNAVDSSQIVGTEAEKLTRAEGIVEVFFENDTKNKQILDYGCGEGHVAYLAAKQGAKLSVGYDIVKNDTWTTKFVDAPNLTLTDNLDVVRAGAPYDHVLLYDVLDHCVDPIAVLKQTKAMLATGGKVVVRNHPWCCRHGGHLYRSINKAFIHLFLSESTVTKLSGGQAPIQKVIHPQNTYAQWFDTAGLNVDNRENVQSTLEVFFSQEPRRSRIVQWWRTSPIPEHASGAVFPEFPMSQEFIDYVLSVKG